VQDTARVVWSGGLFSSGGYLRFYFSSISLFLTFLVLSYEKALSVSSLFYVTSYISLLYFRVDSLIVLYMAFEVVMVPVLLMVLLWGSQPEKLSSVYYIAVYTGLFSFPFVAVIVQVEG